jgi:cardiolipin synthase
MANKKARNQNLTVPNLLSLIRIIIVPFFAYYFMKDNILLAVILIAASGLSDAFDGLIARKFNQVTELGKILDPFADKITQGTVALCIAVKYPMICPFLILFIVKELTMLTLAIVLLKKKKKPCAAKWYGKISTILFYISVVVIVGMSMFKVETVTFNLVSYLMLCITAVMMVYSAIKYFAIFRELLKSDNPYDAIDIHQEMKTKK